MLFYTSLYGYYCATWFMVSYVNIHLVLCKTDIITSVDALPESKIMINERLNNKNRVQNHCRRESRSQKTLQVFYTSNKNKNIAVTNDYSGNNNWEFQEIPPEPLQLITPLTIK